MTDSITNIKNIHSKPKQFKQKDKINFLLN